jgi:hypothetical protein
MKFDLHIHTSRHSPDSILDPHVLCRKAKEIGLDGIVITEHDWLWTAKELQQLRAEHPGLVILAGVEVSAFEGHFLAYGVTDPFRVPHGIKVQALCKEVHRQGGVVVAAHPFRWRQPFLEILAKQKPDLDGLELMTNNMDDDCRRKAAEVREKLNITGLGSSDAHDEDVLGRCYTEFASPITSMEDLVAAIRSGKCSAHDRLAA